LRGSSGCHRKVVKCRLLLLLLLMLLLLLLQPLLLLLLLLLQPLWLVLLHHVLIHQLRPSPDRSMSLLPRSARLCLHLQMLRWPLLIRGGRLGGWLASWIGDTPRCQQHLLLLLLAKFSIHLHRLPPGMSGGVRGDKVHPCQFAR
jgi:hypothetical protein